jgi:negative regulator of genetic competence, sporulation and motility
MELIRISDSKLKIMLTPTDMCHFELCNESMGDDSAKMRQAFRHLMDEVKKQIGFDVDDRHISIQYFPSREGGCEMFVTNHPVISNTKEEKALAKPLNALFPTAAKTCGAFRKDCAYRFDDLDHLLQVCKRLCQMGYIGDSSAFRDEKKQYYLILTLLCASPFSTPEELSFVLEYGYWENPSLLKIYIKEHGKLLCSPDAVEQLGRLQ